MLIFSLTTVLITYRCQNIVRKHQRVHADILTIESMTIASKLYTPLKCQQLILCRKIGAHLLISASQCNVTYLIDSEREPTILDAGDELLLTNVLRPWTMLCEPDSRLFSVSPQSYRIINSMEL